jgi:hypothetical protein
MNTISPKCGSIITITVLIMVFGCCQTLVAGNPPQANHEKSIAAGQEVEEAFMANLTGKPRDEKLAAIRQNSIRQYEKNKTLREKNYQQSLNKYNTNLQARGMAARGIIENRIAALDRNFNELQEFVAAKHQETLAFIDQLKAQAILDGAALDQALREFFRSQRAAVQKRSEEYLQRQREIHMQSRREGGGAY